MKRIYILICVFLLNMPLYALTWADILSQVRLLENDNKSTAYRYTDQQLLDRANIVQDDICAKTYCLQTRYYITTSTNTAEYRLPSDCIQILRVGYAINATSGTYKRLIYTTIGGQDASNKFWENLAPNEPQEYYRRADYIGLKPAPSSSYEGTNFIQLDYVIKASSMTNTTDVPLNGDYGLYVFHQAIVYGVVALCEFDKGDTNKYTTMQTIYIDWLNKIRDIVNNAPEKGYLNFTK